MTQILSHSDAGRDGNGIFRQGRVDWRAFDSVNFIQGVFFSGLFLQLPY